MRSLVDEYYFSSSHTHYAAPNDVLVNILMTYMKRTKFMTITSSAYERGTTLYLLIIEYIQRRLNKIRNFLQNAIHAAIHGVNPTYPDLVMEDDLLPNPYLVMKALYKSCKLNATGLSTSRLGRFTLLCHAARDFENFTPDGATSPLKMYSTVGDDSSKFHKGFLPHVDNYLTNLVQEHENDRNGLSKLVADVLDAHLDASQVHDFTKNGCKKITRTNNTDERAENVRMSSGGDDDEDGDDDD